ncbi:hypothetical protein HanXRQr2_Chr08g0317321 [Helianthus annuus]|uniref:Uncharacterized protein n=1 Tax=Helianthus annuus TaxID=4232 RepID=A0A9K3NAZ0_HELAN|nr:hypothetical protein HanXRQr2_Chr08g0317321 [Helianthus annuus]
MHFHADHLNQKTIISLSFLKALHFLYNHIQPALVDVVSLVLRKSCVSSCCYMLHLTFFASCLGYFSFFFLLVALVKVKSGRIWSNIQPYICCMSL